MFHFNFGDTQKSDEENKIEDTEPTWLESEEIPINPSQLENNVVEDDCEVDIIKLNENVNIYHVSVDIIVEKLKDENKVVSLAEKNKSDLLTAIYEGGLKIWECTYDLAKFIIEEKIQFKNKNVLDLGCGTGILGVYCYINQANVYFQDYNPEVLRYVTIPNVLLNIEEDNKNENVKKCKFYSGDWESFLNAMKDKLVDEDKFDYILTCETIYNPKNYKKLLGIFKTLLKKDGIIYLAAKSYYFGVGGSLREFEEIIANDFSYFTCWKCSDGVNREILKIQFKSYAIYYFLLTPTNFYLNNSTLFFNYCTFVQTYFKLKNIDNIKLSSL